MESSFLCRPSHILRLVAAPRIALTLEHLERTILPDLIKKLLHRFAFCRHPLAMMWPFMGKRSTNETRQCVRFRLLTT